MNIFKSFILLTFLIAVFSVVESTRTNLKAKKAKSFIKNFNRLMRGGGSYENLLKKFNHYAENIQAVGEQIFGMVDKDADGRIDELEGEKALDFFCKDTLIEKKECRDHIKEIAMQYAGENGINKEGFVATVGDLVNDTIEYLENMGEEEYNLRKGIKEIKKLLNDQGTMDYVTEYLFKASDKNGDKEVNAEELDQAMAVVFNVEEKDREEVKAHLTNSGVLDDEVIDEEEFAGVVYQYFYQITVKLQGDLDKLTQEKEALKKQEEQKEEKKVEEEEEEVDITPIFLKKN